MSKPHAPTIRAHIHVLVTLVGLEMDSLVKVCRNTSSYVRFHSVNKYFSKKFRMISLSDINECEVDLDNCDVQATCTNSLGSYSCACNTGWTGDGFTCEGM